MTGEPRGEPDSSELPWTRYADAVTRFGWRTSRENGHDVLEVPTLDGEGLPARTKIRGARKPDGRLRTYWRDDGTTQGLAGDVFALDSIDADRVVCVLTGSETDALALADAAEREDLPVRVLCSCSETRSLTDLLAGGWYRGLRWCVIGDADETGRTHAPRRALEILRHSGSPGVRLVFPRAPFKDARAALEAGDALADLIRQPNALRVPTRPQSPARRSGERADRLAEAVLRGELDRLSQAAPGSRESTLVACGFRIGRKALHSVSFESAHEQLVAVATSIGLPIREARDKARRALRAGQREAIAP